MENNISHIHDKMFKETFGDLAIAADFLKIYWPETLDVDVDFNTLELQKGSFVTQEFRELFTDLLFKAKIDGSDGYICFLFEHKSYPDRLVLYQILTYIAQIWLRVDKDNIEETPPMVVPLLIYNGKNKWSYDTSIFERMPWYNGLSEKSKEFVPAYRFAMYDLSEMDLDIKIATAMQLILKVMRDVRLLDKAGIIATIQEIMMAYAHKHEDDKITYYVRLCLKYVLSVKSDFTGEDLLSIANQVSREGSELIMTLAEQLRQEGRQEGQFEATIKIVKNAFSMNMKPDQIMKLTGLTMEELEEIKRKIPQ